MIHAGTWRELKHKKPAFFYAVILAAKRNAL